MPVATAPSAEACQAIVDRINSGSGITYTLPSAATYTRELTEDLTDPSELEVTVVHDRQTDLQKRLDVEDLTSHAMRVVVRKKLDGGYAQADVDALELITRQIFQRLNEYRSGRVSVWDCGVADDIAPDKRLLRQANLYEATIPMRVEVEASP